MIIMIIVIVIITILLVYPVGARGGCVLPYSTLAANSVKSMFPFQVCKISPKQPPNLFQRGVRIWRV